MAKQIAASAGKIVLAFLLAFGLTLVVMIPVLGITAWTISASGKGASYFFEHMLSSQVFNYGSMVAQAVGFAAAVPLMYRWFEKSRGWSIGWKRRDWLKETLKGALFGIVLMTVIFIVMWGIGAIELTGMNWNGFVWNGLIGYLLLFAVVSINEELFSRGYVQGLIRYRFGRTAAVAVSSLFFALLHAFNPGALDHPLPLVNLFAAGILLAVCREVTGSLWFPIGLHWTWNYMQGNVFGFEVSGTHVASLLELQAKGPALLSGGAFGAEGSIVATAAMAIGIYWLIGKKGRRSRAAHNAAEDGKV